MLPSAARGARDAALRCGKHQNQNPRKPAKKFRALTVCVHRFFCFSPRALARYPVRTQSDGCGCACDTKISNASCVTASQSRNQTRRTHVRCDIVIRIRQCFRSSPVPPLDCVCFRVCRTHRVRVPVLCPPLTQVLTQLVFIPRLFRLPGASASAIPSARIRGRVCFVAFLLPRNLRATVCCGRVGPHSPFFSAAFGCLWRAFGAPPASHCHPLHFSHIIRHYIIRHYIDPSNVFNRLRDRCGFGL